MKRPHLFIFLYLVIAVFCACTTTVTEPYQPPPPPELPPNSQEPNPEIDAYIRTIPVLPAPTSTPGLTKLGPILKYTSKDADSINYFCEEQEFKLTAHFDKFIQFNSNHDALWPGALIQSRDLKNDGSLNPIGQARAPVTISINLLAKNVSRTINNPIKSTVVAAINDILLSNQGSSAPADIRFEKHESFTLEQTFTSAGFNFDWLPASFKNDFSVQTSIEKRSVFVKFTQKYYTITIDTPESPSMVFDTTVTLGQIKNYTSFGNPMAYISSVTYGRTLLFMMTSTRCFADMNAAVEFKFTGRIIAGYTKKEVEKILQEITDIRVTVIGGSQQGAIDIITSHKIDEYLQDGANFSAGAPGAPLQISVRFLNGNKLAKFDYTTQPYTAIKCKPDVIKIMVTIKKIYVNNTCEPSSKWQGEFYYEFKVNGEVVAAITDREARSRKKGDSIEINQSIITRIFKRPEEELIIEGWVKEDDGRTSDDELVGKFIDTYRYDVNWPAAGEYKRQLKKDSNCEVTVYYEIAFL